MTGDTWWREYYESLERRIQELRINYIDDPEALAVLDKEQQEVEMFKRDPTGSVFFVMQKI